MVGRFFGNQIILGNNTLYNDIVGFASYRNSNSIFLAKLDENGNFIWARKPLSSNLQDVYAGNLGIDDSGNTYFSGVFAGTDWLVFGTDTLSNTDKNDYDLFIAKNDAAGNALWGRQSNAKGGETAMATDPAGNTYSLVWVSPFIVLGGDTITDSWTYIIKYIRSGSLKWIKKSPTVKTSCITTDKLGTFFLSDLFMVRLHWAHII